MGEKMGRLYKFFGSAKRERGGGYALLAELLRRVLA